LKATKRDLKEIKLFHFLDLLVQVN